MKKQLKPNGYYESDLIKIYDWINELLQDINKNFDHENGKFCAVVARFSGLNIPNEKYQSLSQLANGVDDLYHYEFAPQNKNGSLINRSKEGPLISSDDLKTNLDIFVSSPLIPTKTILVTAIGQTGWKQSVLFVCIRPHVPSWSERRRHEIFTGYK